MSRVRGAGAFVWDFVVGDDWVTAVGVALALGLTAVVAQSTPADWWILPLAVVALLALYLWRVARARPAPDLRADEGDAPTGPSRR